MISRPIFFLFLVGLAMITSLAYQFFKQDWVLFRQGEQLFQNRRFQEARPVFEAAWNKGLRCPPLVLEFHETLLAEGIASQALELTRQLIREGGELGVLVPVTDLYFSYARQELVAVYAMDLARLYPRNRIARFTAARLFSRLGQFDEAARQYRQGLGEMAP
jgi:tetratricopeptide (TPR) repeat protein